MYFCCNSKYFLHANTHSHCIFFDFTFKQGSSKLQARKPPQKIHILIVGFVWRFLSLIIYIVFCSCKVLVFRPNREGAFRCLCRISKPYNRRTHPFSSIRDCDMARIYFPTPPKNRLCRYCLGDSRCVCWCMLIYCRRKAPRQ